MSSFSVLFESYRRLLSKKDLEEKESPESKESPSTSSITSSDIQSATKKIFTIAINQNTATLNKLQFYETVSIYFININQPKEKQTETKDNNTNNSNNTNTNNNSISCTPLLREIGWDLLTELFLLYNKDNRFESLLWGICSDISPRELSIMFSEVFTHPMLSIAATHNHYQLHTIQNHYILNDEDSEQQKQMMLNLNITNQQINMDASDDILAFHKNINYIKTQTLFVKCIVILFQKLTSKTANISKHSINHFYQSLIPTAILHFQTLSKELSYQFYLHNTTQYHNHHHHNDMNDSRNTRARSMSSDSVKALDATKKQRQEWLINSKTQYEIYLKSIYKLFNVMVNNHCNLRSTDHGIKDEVVDVSQLIQCFQPQGNGDESDEESKEEKLTKSNNINTLWLAKYGFGVLSGVYWWYNVFYNEDIEYEGDVNNDSMEILQNIKKPGYNIFLNDHVDSLKREISVKLCHNVGMNGNVLFAIRSYITQLENNLESEKPWHLNSDQLMNASGSKSNPSTPTPQLQPMSSIGHPDLNTIVEEQEDEDDDEMCDITNKMNDGSTANNIQIINESTAVINEKEILINGIKAVDEDNDNDNEDEFVETGDGDDGWDDNNNSNSQNDDIDFGDVDPSKLKKVQETQQLVDELKDWNEYIDLFGVSCYYHSLWVLLQSDDCIENNGAAFKRHSKHIWKCIHLLFEQLTTLPAGIEFGEFVLNVRHPTQIRNTNQKNTTLDLNKLLSSQQFHSQGLWQLVQYLTSQLKGISDRALHQKLWQFIVHLINSADLKTRFQCIVSTALQCPIPVVQSLMFTELKNQIFNNWNIDVLQSATTTSTKEENDEEENENENENKSDEDDDDDMIFMEDALNPFCSRQVVMVLVQRLGKELQNMSLQTINSELDSLNACLNLCRFILTKDKGTNYTQIYDDDCPLKHVIQSLYDEMGAIANTSDDNKHGKQENNNNQQKKNKNDQINELEQFQRQMMKNQFLVSLDLVKRIQEMYHK